MLSRSLTALLRSRRSLRDTGGDVGLGLRSKDRSSYECEACGRIVPPSLMRLDARGALCCPECQDGSPKKKKKQPDHLRQGGDMLTPCGGIADMDVPGRVEDVDEDLLASADTFWGRGVSEPAPSGRSRAATLTKSTRQAAKMPTLPPLDALGSPKLLAPQRQTSENYDAATSAGDDDLESVGSGGIWQRSVSEDICVKSAPVTPAGHMKRLASKLSVFSTPSSQASRSSSVSSAANRQRKNSTDSGVPPQLKRALSMAQSPSEYRRIQRIMTAELAIAG